MVCNQMWLLLPLLCYGASVLLRLEPLLVHSEVLLCVWSSGTSADPVLLHVEDHLSLSHSIKSKLTFISVKLELKVF